MSDDWDDGDVGDAGDGEVAPEEELPPQEEVPPEEEVAPEEEIPPEGEILPDQQYATDEDYVGDEYGPEDVYGSRDDYPQADEEDFEEDYGDWNDQDYAASAQNLFGDHEYFGDTAQDRYIDAGYQPFEHNAQYQSQLEQHVPGAASTVDFFRMGEQIIPQGFITVAALALLQRQFPQMDFSQLNVSVPPRPGDEPPVPQPLPPALAALQPADTVDLRKYCTAVDDQGQTSRCSAFAWTHAAELAANLRGDNAVPLSVNYTMLTFQRRQGEERGYQYAYQGGDGTAPGTDPGQALIEQGTCRRSYWPNDNPAPVTDEATMQADARGFLLPADVQCIALDDVRKVLTAGSPVHVAMNTGESFANVGRDGLFNAAEQPSGRHGRHAMLIVGYVGNYYVVKNSWGADWGDQGYCYMPKKVLADSEPELVAVLVRKPVSAVGNGAGTVAAAAVATGVSPPTALPARGSTQAAAAAPVVVTTDRARITCPECRAVVPVAKFCVSCGRPLPAACPACGAVPRPGAHFCVSCGTRLA